MAQQQTTKNFGVAAICATAFFGGGCASDDLGDGPDEQASSLANHAFNTTGMEEHLSEARAARGRMFLAKNENRPGVKTRPSGLQFEVLEAGDGERPTLRDIVVTHYKVSLIDGTVVDNSEDYGGAQEFRVDKVIAGWREALQEMRAGAKWKLYLPPELAYGDQGMAQIPGGETLIYELELLSVQHGHSPEGVEEIEPLDLTEPLDPEPERAPDKPPEVPRGRDLSLDNLDLLD